MVVFSSAMKSKWIVSAFRIIIGFMTEPIPILSRAKVTSGFSFLPLFEAAFEYDPKPIEHLECSTSFCP